MQASSKRPILPGREFDHLFPPALGSTLTVKHHATLEDSIELILEKIRATARDTERLAPMLKGDSVLETCRNIWNFSFHHIQYEKDEDGKEQVRRPSRSWKDRKTGIDCDCFSVFNGTILYNLGIPFKLRITKYADPLNPETRVKDLPFSHIYLVVPDQGKEIVIDPVHTRFNEEVPYAHKKDISMKLEFLSGPPEGSVPNMDAEDLFDQGTVYGFDTLEGKKKAAKKSAKASNPSLPAKPKPKGVAKVAHAVNKFNPTVAPLRLGMLAAMKLNVLNVAGRLRFAYLSEEEARRKGFNPSKMARLRQVMQKLEKIFFGAGGKSENLKKAILESKANKDKQVPVSGLGYIEQGLTEYHPLQTVLGDEIYESEFNPEESEAVNGLGEVATAAAIGVATTALTAIAALLKSIGDLKSAKEGPAPGSEDAGGGDAGGEGGSNLPVPSEEKSGEGAEGGDSADDSGEKEEKGIIPWIKKNPLKAAGIGLLAAGGIYLGYKALSGGGKSGGRKKRKSEELSGLSKHKGKSKGRKAKPRKRRKSDSGLKVLHLR